MIKDDHMIDPEEFIRRLATDFQYGMTEDDPLWTFVSGLNILFGQMVRVFNRSIEKMTGELTEAVEASHNKANEANVRLMKAGANAARDLVKEVCYEVAIETVKMIREETQRGQFALRVEKAQVKSHYRTFLVAGALSCLGGFSALIAAVIMVLWS